jgi:hypothetical protein
LGECNKKWLNLLENDGPRRCLQTFRFGNLFAIEKFPIMSKKQNYITLDDVLLDPTYINDSI